MARIWVAIILLVGIYVNLFGLWLYRKPSEATQMDAVPAMGRAI